MLSARGKPRRFVGRAAQLEILEAALEAAGSECGSVVLVGGEAGIGKTRLAAELVDRAHRAGALVLIGHCIDLVGTGLPYLAVLEALRPLRGAPCAPTSTSCHGSPRSPPRPANEHRRATTEVRTGRFDCSWKCAT